jgi:hypothetical protein
MKNKILWITRTAVMMALLVTLQWATSGLGQFVTGSCVNAVLAITTLTAGLWSGVAVALLSPFCAFLLGIGPKLIQLIPAIALGNVVLVWMVALLLGGKALPWWRKALGVALSAFAKFLILYLAVVQVIIPIMGPQLAQKQVQTFTAMFSWPQLVTALIGTTVAALIAPLIRKAIK